MKKNLFLIGLCLAIFATATLVVCRHFTRNQNPVTATASQPELVATTQTTVESAPVAQTRTVTVRLTGLTPVAPGQTNSVNQ